MSDDEKSGDLQIGIVMGELRAGVERLQRASEQNAAQNTHILEVTNGLSKVAEGLATHMVSIDHRLDLLETRPRAGSFTTEAVRTIVAAENEKQSAANSESIKVAALEASKPAVAEAQKQTKELETQTKVLETQTGAVTAGLANQTKVITRATIAGWILAGLASGLWSAVQHLFFK